MFYYYFSFNNIKNTKDNVRGLSWVELRITNQNFYFVYDLEKVVRP